MNKTPSQVGVNAKTSLKHQKNPLAVAANQLKVLNGANGSDAVLSTPTRIEVDETRRPRFDRLLERHDATPLTANGVEILQVNLGKMCNMTCTHCHVDAGPDRREIMTRDTIDACLSVLRKNPEIGTLDLTGGAPEMNPHFREMVVAAREMDRHVIDRCNLTILLAKGFEYLPDFLAEHEVEIVASLPCYLEDNTDKQRGEGAYSKSVEALTRLNELGYGKPNSGLTLTLVFNPVGQSLPPDQAQLEEAYRKELKARFGIEFNRLFTITNMPVSRYLDYLMKIGELESYMQTLIDAFNPASIQGLMCRNTISVSWDGKLYDCDFNQMLELDLEAGCPKTIHDFDFQQLGNRQITIDQHCFGCTAGCGSGCQGSTTQ
jgi:radical SAM/Cys-rich protein